MDRRSFEVVDMVDAAVDHPQHSLFSDRFVFVTPAGVETLARSLQELVPDALPDEVSPLPLDIGGKQCLIRLPAIIGDIASSQSEDGDVFLEAPDHSRLAVLQHTGSPLPHLPDRGDLRSIRILGALMIAWLFDDTATSRCAARIDGAVGSGQTLTFHIVARSHEVRALYLSALADLSFVES